MLTKIIKLILTWRVVLWIVAIIASFIFPLNPDFTPVTSSFSWINIFNMWANFDGMHYLELAHYGYGSTHTQFLYVFFPLYPYLITNFIPENLLAGGLLISHLALIISFYYLYLLVKLDHTKKTALTTLVLILIFPVSFFFGAVYTESLFFLFVVLTFYSARKNHFIFASVFALLASITRFTGIFLWPALVVEIYLLNHKQIKQTLLDARIILVSLIPPLGLLSYLKFQYLKTGDPLYFINVQPDFGAERVVDKFIFIHQVFYRYLKMLIFVDHTNPLFFTVLLEFIIGLGFLALILISLKKTRVSYAVFALFSFFLPTLTGTFSSLPRYVLVLFPAFIVAAIYFNKLPYKWQVFCVTILTIFSLVSVCLFTRGYFIA
jgi:Gpi18-like mannosyltransferase